MRFYRPHEWVDLGTVVDYCTITEDYFCFFLTFLYFEVSYVYNACDYFYPFFLNANAYVFLLKGCKLQRPLQKHAMNNKSPKINPVVILHFRGQLLYSFCLPENIIINKKLQVLLFQFPKLFPGSDSGCSSLSFVENSSTKQKSLTRVLRLMYFLMIWMFH